MRIQCELREFGKSGMRGCMFLCLASAFDSGGFGAQSSCCSASLFERRQTPMCMGRSRCACCSGCGGRADRLKSLGQDFGDSIRIVVWVDAQATIGLGCRSAFGKHRHIGFCEFGIQDLLESAGRELRKVGGKHLAVDMLTKAVSREIVDHNFPRARRRSVHWAGNP